MNPTLTPLHIVQETLAIAELLSIPVGIAQVEAVRRVEMETGIDYSHLLKYSPYVGSTKMLKDRLCREPIDDYFDDNDFDNSDTE